MCPRNHGCCEVELQVVDPGPRQDKGGAVPKNAAAAEREALIARERAADQRTRLANERERRADEREAIG